MFPEEDAWLWSMRAARQLNPPPNSLSGC